jgi:PEP-CTERM/exosortase A-associated glycosyltransferase
LFNDQFTAGSIYGSLRLKILHLLNHSLPHYTGYTYRTMSLLRTQVAKGWEPILLTSSKQPGLFPDHETLEDWSVYRTQKGAVSTIPVLNQWDVIHSLKQRIAAVIEEERPDVLHSHSPSLVGMAALSAAKKFNIPMVYEIRAFWEDAGVDQGRVKLGGLRYRLSRALETYVCKRSEAVITICEGLRNELITSRGIDDKKISVIGNGVDPSDFAATNEEAEKLRISLDLRNGPVAGFFGTFFHYEGLDLAIKAWPLVLKQIPDAQLLIVGSGEMENELKALVCAMKMEDSVLMPGRIPHSQIAAAYHLCDCVVFPRYSERITELVTPLKPLEAMAGNRPVLASDVGGHRELIADGENGLLFKPNCQQDLSEKLTSLLKDKDLQGKLCKGGRRVSTNTRTWEAVTEPHEMIYKQLLQSRG